MNFKKFFILFSISFAFSQFNNVEVSLEHNRLSENDVYKLESLKKEIKNYFSYNDFCQEYDFANIDLNVHLVIESINPTNFSNIHRVKSHLLISNNEDQFYFSKGIIFEYNPDQSFIYNPYTFKGFESTLNYYAYLFIGYELDKWGFNLGTIYFNKSLEVSFESGRDSIWKKREDQVNEILKNTYLREARFSYFNYLYIINSEIYKENSENYQDEIRSLITKLYDNIFMIYNKFGQDKNTLKFLDFHLESIVLALQYFNMIDEIAFLASYDYNNEQRYLKYLDEE